MNRFPKLCGLLTAFLLAVLPACLTVQSLQSADPHVLHHHNWWNYYERGRLHLREGNPRRAMADFETAMGLQPGARYPYTEDRWRVRTYGMHRMDGYFPNRELGICLFETGRPNEALPYLETSLEMEPSGRAKFYLNLVRGNLAAAAAPPRIELAGLALWTSKQNLMLRGSVCGNTPVREIQINGHPEFIELAEKQISFERDLELSVGSNRISIVTTDLAGQRTETNLLIMADWQPPQLSLQGAIPVRGGYDVSIQCRDDFSPATLQMNGRKLVLSSCDQTVHGRVTPGEFLRLSAVDRAGNRIEWKLGEEDVRRFAGLRPDTAPPRLHLADAGKTITLCSEEYLLDLRAEDEVSLQSIQLNGESLLTEPGPLFRTQRHIPLNSGTNRLVIVATDTAGKQTEKQITLIRREPEYLDRRYRLAATLPPLGGELPDNTFRRRTELLLGREITRDPVRFYLLAGENEAEKLLSEQTLSATRLADPRATLQAGKQLDSDLIFNCRVLSDGDGQTVYTQVLDAESGDELFIEDVYLEDPKNLPQQIGGLILKIEQRFPLVKARITGQNKRVSIDAGRQTGVRKGARFLVVRSDGSFREGRVLKSGGRPAELLISKVESENAQGILATGSTPVQPGDYVFTR